jgi:hypothetical protein
VIPTGTTGKARPSRAGGAERQPRGARLERLERRARVADPLGEEGDRVAGGERRLGGTEGVGVGGAAVLAGGALGGRVLRAVHGDRSARPHQPPHLRVVEQRRLGQEARRAPDGHRDERRVEQRVRMVGDDEQRARDRRGAQGPAGAPSDASARSRR